MLFKWLWFEPPDLHENSFGKFGLQTSNFWAQIPRSKLFSPWANGLVEGEATVFSHQIQICSADLRFTSGNYWEKNHTSHLTTAGLLGNIGYMLGVKVAIILVYMYAYIYIWLLIKIPLSRDGHSSRINILLSRNFRKLHHVGQQHLL